MQDKPIIFLIQHFIVCYTLNFLKSLKNVKIGLKVKRLLDRHIWLPV